MVFSPYSFAPSVTFGTDKGLLIKWLRFAFLFQLKAYFAMI